ncbi:hypothetical protein L9G16_11700 [Shewanella sp. A25]|nr:hypothetical protein [Shewanella shenzhenensis]
MQYKSIIITALVVLLLSACSSPAPKIKPAELVVINNSGQTVEKIIATPCSDDGDTVLYAGGTVLAEMLKTGRSVRFKFETSCANLQAFNRDGFIIARQLRVSTPPDLTWHIN